MRKKHDHETKDRAVRNALQAHRRGVPQFQVSWRAIRRTNKQAKTGWRAVRITEFNGNPPSEST